MISQADVPQLIGADVYGADGDKIGSAGQVYLDNQTGQPEWLSVRTGFFGTKESFVPLSQASFTNGRVEVPFDKDRVKDAPRIDPDGALSPAEEDELYRHYGTAQDYATAPGYGTAQDYGTAPDTVGRDISGPTTDDAMTRSEERLNVGTRTEQVGTARLRKYVVTEQEQVTVPVSREEVRVEREPITDANIGDALDGPGISEEEHEVTLHAERPVVATEAVPVERVRLDTQTVTEQETVSGQVRKEQIDFDGDSDSDVTERATNRKSRRA
jgi:uncharacterized protein (TIGR02271 family)